jgi:DNA-directed RNA polymerase beta subunit
MFERPNSALSKQPTIFQMYATNKLKDLDIDGIIRVGAYVQWEVTSSSVRSLQKEKSNSPLRSDSSERSFGDKSKDVKDSSLVIPCRIRR